MSAPHGKAQLGRADLLRAWVGLHGPRSEALDEAALAGVGARLGFAPHAPEAPGWPGIEMMFRGAEPAPALGAVPEAEPEYAPIPVAPPLQTRFLALLQTLEQPTRGSDAFTPAAEQPFLTPADCGPRPGAQPMPFRPLVPTSRLWPALKQSVAQPQARGVDVPRLVDQVARGEMLARLPRQSRQGAVGQVWVVRDVARRLIPCDEDYQQILAEIRRLFGPDQVWLWIVDDDPRAVGWVYRGRAEVARVSGPMPPPPVGMPVLILGDLGRLARAPRQARAWDAACQRWAAGGALPVAWLPASPARVAPGLTPHVRAYSLGPGPLRPVAPRPEGAPHADESLESLLTRLACALRVEPRLLRDVRRLAPETAQEPALEVLAWDAPQVASGYRCCELRPARLPAYRARFAALSAPQQDAVLGTMLAHHASGGRSTETLEALIWHAHVGRLPLGTAAQHRLQEAAEWFHRLTESPQPPGDLAGYAHDLLGRQQADARLMEAQSPALSRLWALTGQLQPPAGLRAADVAQALNAPAGPEERSYLLIQRGQQVFLEPETLQRFPWPKVRIRGEWFEWGREGESSQSLRIPSEGERLGLPLSLSQGNVVYVLRDSLRIYRFVWLLRPSWSSCLGFDRQGLYVFLSPIFEVGLKLMWQCCDDHKSVVKVGGSGFSTTAVTVELNRDDFSIRALSKFRRGFSVKKVSQLPHNGRLSFGADLEFGAYVDIEIGSGSQRLRWIPAGEFWMGTPDSEQARDESERPRHRVRLSHGYWLADTACSQAFWSALMGGNPSHFEAPLHPVEMVTWREVREFLAALERLFPAVQVRLPTEAEWEYACRAGSESDFSWGEGIDPMLANCDFGYGYKEGSQGGGKKRTVQVKRFQPNHFGLYQMHGNVWELCADGKREYSAEAQLDPWGPEVTSGESVLVRGGSWASEPGFLRAASRHRLSLEKGDPLVGFRFMIRGL
ncbi:SUMF1/EgtB/PvdO family nonheme iron enzyme [Zoogloea sp.]|uniref:SUMF1/EgtB/PvdO family nonheme iron enzyme n=1 Tax=Zoogloea sp. TaxID=49181 RepID=UPI0035AF3BF2